MVAGLVRVDRMTIVVDEPEALVSQQNGQVRALHLLHDRDLSRSLFNPDRLLEWKLRVPFARPGIVWRAAGGSIGNLLLAALVKMPLAACRRSQPCCRLLPPRRPC